jgi:hypothetical protein
MLQDIQGWLDALTEKIRAEFGGRVLYIGLGGSHARGEANEDSDIDINVVLDEVGIGDLEKYRVLVRSMPYSDMACGFIGGRAEMAAWPKHELFQFMRCSRSLYGSLEGIALPPEDRDIAAHIRITASAIYHEACHRCIYGDNSAQEAEQLRGAYKAAFFALQEQVYLRERRYIATHRELLAHLTPAEAEVLRMDMNWDSRQAERQADPRRCFEVLRAWSSAALRGAGGKQA